MFICLREAVFSTFIVWNRKGWAKYITNLYWLYQPPKTVEQEFCLAHLKLSGGGTSAIFWQKTASGCHIFCKIKRLILHFILVSSRLASGLQPVHTAIYWPLCKLLEGSLWKHSKCAWKYTVPFKFVQAHQMERFPNPLNLFHTSIC